MGKLNRPEAGDKRQRLGQPDLLYKMELRALHKIGQHQSYSFAGRYNSANNKWHYD
ncbi:MAG: hypothetical protein UW76_C0018G0013 [Parcubacteria group bacterium GW2011_GWF2_44_8b]|nr:MAG: hypothetical protein UW76_C0018G0013 [Parcubacteria group bacterium GW2011_GWF2_44_8b]